MNALAWFLATLASLYLTYVFFGQLGGPVFALAGWMSVGLAFFSTAATLVGLWEDYQTWTRRDD